MSMKLVIVEGPDRGKEFPLAEGEVLLGRTNETEIELPSNKVSRKHAAIHIGSGQVEIEDLGSSNGTYLNGKRINGRLTVPPGGKIGVGEYLLEIANGEQRGRSQSAAKVSPKKSVMVVAGPAAQPRPGPAGRSQARPVVPSEKARKAADAVASKVDGLPWRYQVYLIVALMVLGGFGSIAFVISSAQKDYAHVADARAMLLAQKFAAENTEYIYKRETLLLRTEELTKEPGVKEASLIDASGIVLAPVLLKGGRSNDPAVLEALKKTGDFSVSVVPHRDGGQLEIAAPIQYWNREKGRFDLVGVAYLLYAPDEVARQATAPALLYTIALLGVSLGAGIGAFFLLRATERPIARMQEDTELVIRGDLKAVQSSVPMKELEALAHSITRLFEKGGGPSLASSSVFTGAPSGNQLALPAEAGPVDNAGASATVRALVTAIESAVLVVDADSNVVEVNAAAERMFGLIPARVRGKHLLEAITDKQLLAEVLDLLNEIAAAPSGVITRSVNVPGPNGVSVAGRVSAAGVRQGRELAGSAIIISAGRQEEAA